MPLRPLRLITVAGIVGLPAVQCGFSVDMLTTVSRDSDGDTVTQLEMTETDSVKETSGVSTDMTTGESDDALDTEIASDTSSGAVTGTASESETLGNEDTGSDGVTDTASESETPSDEDTGSDSGVCSHEEIRPSEVLLIGDSWIAIPGSRVGELARAAGVIKFNEDYVYRAVVGATIGEIVQQYNSYTTSVDAEVKVVIMNGGAVDTYGALGSEKSISYVAETFSGFLSQLAEDGVALHVIYVLYAEGTAIPGVAELRPPMMAACADSAVPCHFVDLQPLWEGHTGYMSIENINPSSAGSDVIAAAIWQTMQDNCIAQ
jgi:hypothetical protein